MVIRKTQKEDLNRIMEIYAYARKFMADHGNPNQWGPTNWPPQHLLENDIKEEKSYVCVDDDGEILGVFYFDQGVDIEPTYRVIEDGAWKDESSYGVVHRIASAGTQKGVGAFCINWAFEQCGHLRIDTHTDNSVMQSLLNKLGFEMRGIIHVVEDSYPRYAYERC